MARSYVRNGLYVELGAYKCHVFLDWREVQDNEWHQYAHLADYLDGRGVPSIEEALREVFLQPIHAPFRELVNAGHLRLLMDNRVTEPDGQLDEEIMIETERRALRLLSEAKQLAGGTGDQAGLAPAEPEVIAQEIRRKLEAILHLPVLDTRFPLPGSRGYRAALEMVQACLNDDPAAWGTLLSWLFTHSLGRVAGDEGAAGRSRSWMDEWLLGKLAAGALRDLGLDDAGIWWAIGTIKTLINHQGWHELEAAESEQAHQVLASWLRDSEVQHFLQVNRYRDVLWFNHETWEQLLGWMLTLAIVDITTKPELVPEEAARQIDACYDLVETLQQAEEASEYQVAKLMEAVRD